jgi:hypothetical protein
MSFTLSLVPLLMVMGLIAPFIGPAIDHHYADRSAVHAHALIGDATNEHNHSSAFDAHDHLSGNNGDGVSVATASANSVHGPLTLDGATLESFAPIYDDHMIAIHIGAPPSPDEEALAPLDRPPRLA